MKGLVIFTSKYGSTRQYAEWVGQHFDIPVNSIQLLNNTVPESDYYILGSPVYMGKLTIKDWFVRNREAFRNKKVFLFVVGGTRENETETISKIFCDNLPDKSMHIETFYVRGRLVKEAMKLKDRFMLKMGALLTGNKEKRNEMLKDFDEVRSIHLAPLYESVDRFLSAGNPRVRPEASKALR